MSTDELITWLKPTFEKLQIDSSALETIRSSDIDGKVFCSLKLEDIRLILPDLSFGKCKKVLNRRDSEAEVFDQISKATKTEIALRPFGCQRKASDKYKFHGKIPEIETRITNRIQPIHKFVDLSSRTTTDISSIMINHMVEFACACLNERTNGTVHFAIKDGSVFGIDIDPLQCIKDFDDGIQSFFCEDQVKAALRAIRPPQFIPVTGSVSTKCTYIIEVDVEPESRIVGDEPFFLKTSDDEIKMFRISALDGQIRKQSRLEIDQFMKEKASLTKDRENAEKHHLSQTPDRDIRRELREFLCSGTECLDSGLYPLVFTSPPDDDIDKAYLTNHFNFLRLLDVRCVFDFDHRLEENTLYQALTDQGDYFLVKRLNEFDDSQSTTEIAESLEEIKMSAFTTWVYCNGLDVKESGDARTWVKKGMKGFRKMLSFYRDKIPPNRARCIILLLSKNFDIISEAICEIDHLFEHHWIMIAENESIAEEWKGHLLTMHPTKFERGSLDSKTLTGLSWEFLNKTLSQFAEPQVNTKCEVPTTFGAFVEIPKLKVNELCDIEILSRNLCVTGKTDETHEREVEEEFYRGCTVSWWNFHYPEQVLTRQNYKTFLRDVQNALENQIPKGERIGTAAIYHQPGAGGTTLARQILWDLHQEYPCCVVKRLTKDTAKQIKALRCFANVKTPKPPLILIENEDDEKLGEVLSLLSRMAKTEDCKVYCVVLLCFRQVFLPFEKDLYRVRTTLNQELSDKEIAWFEKKHKVLQDSFRKKKGTDPNYLFAFNIMKSNFKLESIKRLTKEFVDSVPDHECDFLLYLSLLNTYESDHRSIPAHCFDKIMSAEPSFGSSKKTWEQRLGVATKVLLNCKQRRTDIGGGVLAFRIITPLLAKEVLSFLMHRKSLDLAQTACQFLASGLFHKNESATSLIECTISMFKKRKWIVTRALGKEKHVKQFLPPVLQAMFDSRDESGAIQTVELAYDILDDPSIAQHAVRLHTELGNFDRAEKMLRFALGQFPNNLYFQHTYGTLYRTQLADIKQTARNDGQEKLDLKTTERAIYLGSQAIRMYEKVEEIHRGAYKGSENLYALTGILETIVHLLETLSVSHCFENMENLRRFYQDTNLVPSSASTLNQTDIPFLRGLQLKAFETMEKLDSFLHVIKADRKPEHRDIRAYIASGSLVWNKEILNDYFGDPDSMPDSFSAEERAEFWRRKARTSGCKSVAKILVQDLDIGSISATLFNLKKNIDTVYTNGFDLMISLACTLKLECKGLTSGIQFEECQLWSKGFFEMQDRENVSVESALLLVLMNWPQSPDKENEMVNHDMLKSAMDRLIVETERSKRQNPLLFLGKNDGFQRIILSRDVMTEMTKSQNSFRCKETVDVIRRFEGILSSSGKCVAVNFQNSANPRALKIELPLESMASNRSIRNKAVTFIVGFSMSGIYAFDVTTETVNDIEMQAIHIPKSYPQERQRSAQQPYRHGMTRENQQRNVQSAEGYEKSTELPWKSVPLSCGPSRLGILHPDYYTGLHSHLDMMNRQLSTPHLTSDQVQIQVSFSNFCQQI